MCYFCLESNSPKHFHSPCECKKECHKECLIKYIQTAESLECSICRKPWGPSIRIRPRKPKEPQCTPLDMNMSKWIIVLVTFYVGVVWTSWPIPNEETFFVITGGILGIPMLWFLSWTMRILWHFVVLCDHKIRVCWRPPVAIVPMPAGAVHSVRARTYDEEEENTSGRV